MKKELNEIYEKNVTNNFVLDKNGVFNSMEQSYQLGITEGEEKYNKLKNAFEELLELWGDYGKYNSSRNHMEESWRKDAGLL